MWHAEALAGSASDATAEAADLVGMLEDDSAIVEAAWFRQSRKIHLVCESVDTRPAPWCRDTPFVQEPIERGVGFTSPSNVAFCQKCLARMPGLVCLVCGVLWLVALTSD